MADLTAKQEIQHLEGMNNELLDEEEKDIAEVNQRVPGQMVVQI